jgi:hypothetical protein
MAAREIVVSSWSLRLAALPRAFRGEVTCGAACGRQSWAQHAGQGPRARGHGHRRRGA